MDRVTADKVIAGKGFAAGILGEMVVGNYYLGEMVVEVVEMIANRYKVACLVKVNSPHRVYCLCPGWDIGFVE